MLSFLMPNPPVPAVEQAILTASNAGIPAISRKIHSKKVIPRYMAYSSIAVVRTLGTSLPTIGPVLSARMRFILPAPDSGRNAIIKTRTPIPPIHCEKLRHSRQLCGKSSTVWKTVAPVVVKPETDSNSASIKLGSSPDKTNGSAPNKLIPIQLRETITYPSLAYSVLLRGLCSTNATPHSRQMPAVKRNPHPAGSRYTSPISAGSSKKTASKLNTHPSTYPIIAKFILFRSPDYTSISQMSCRPRFLETTMTESPI
ncbi:putative uncharacterized protein [Ruminococcus sp. CAG:403]|nr:putative uncharacterized protein [Ruminococcus sp. CAG:403]